jgi:predicted Zn-dependent protease
MSQNPLVELERTLEQLIQTRSGRRAFLMAAPFMLSACAAKAKTRYREGDNTGQETAITVEDEKRMTAEYLPKMRKEYPELRDKEFQSYISNLGQEIVKANNLGGNPYQYRFSVVATPMVNAFALPAGTVFVTVPLIALAETEAELAGVVGHEIGHVTARHTAERMDKAQRESRRSILYGLGGGLLGGAAGFGLGSLLCRKNDRECLARATALGAAAGAGGGLLIQKFAFMANSREDEMEADRIGFRTSVAAGYSKDHVGLFYEKLLKMEEAHRGGRAPLLASVTDAMSTHPPSRERVAQMRQLAAESKKEGTGEVSSKKFESMRKRAEEWTAAQKAKKK